MISVRVRTGPAGITRIRSCRRLLDSPPDPGETIPGTREHIAALLPTRKFMIAVIGNVIAGLGAFSLFTATLRLSKPGKRS
jgi:hypothetical protein